MPAAVAWLRTSNVERSTTLNVQSDFWCLGKKKPGWRGGAHQPGLGFRVAGVYPTLGPAAGAVVAAGPACELPALTILRAAW